MLAESMIRTAQAAAHPESDDEQSENVGSESKMPTAVVNGAGANGAGKKYGLSV
jgi:hypothetical protein